MKKSAGRLTREAKQRTEELRVEAAPYDPWVVLSSLRSHLDNKESSDKETVTTEASTSNTSPLATSPSSLTLLFCSQSPCATSAKKKKTKDDVFVDETFNADGYSNLHALSASSTTSIELIRM